ncbi:lipopolysaccharide export system permease protein [Pseudocitrobacter faecalis]|uniref:Lipopolysaccharide export system permease protein n=2 Tax=Pseudocitrobacter faecalis TaxID=1398493 RepID=A0ABX9FPZ8_9ENTR|nr:lipopolysaccharide export system permease protein [Pseudocitrobacter faecalis]
MRYLFTGFAAAAGLLLPLFSTFNLINELDDVSPGGYHWTQAMLVVLMTLPRCLIDLGPFIALLGGIVGLGLMSKSSELTAIRSTGFSVFRIAMVALCAGVIWAVSLGAIDEWVASPLQQRALQMRNVSMAAGNAIDMTGNVLWARRDNTFMTVKSLNEQGQPMGVEIFHYRDDLSLAFYIYARKATIVKGDKWVLQDVRKKQWHEGRETIESKASLPWNAFFTHMGLDVLSLPGNTFSIRQLNHYIAYLKQTYQPSMEYQLALWQKLGRPVLTLAMILLAIPFAFVTPRSSGLGSRLAMGGILGLLLYISYQIMVNLGLLFALNAPLTALALPTACVIVAILLVRRYDRVR